MRKPVKVVIATCIDQRTAFSLKYCQTFTNDKKENAFMDAPITWARICQSHWPVKMPNHPSAMFVQLKVSKTQPVNQQSLENSSTHALLFSLLKEVYTILPIRSKNGQTFPEFPIFSCFLLIVAVFFFLFQGNRFQKWIIISFHFV